MNEGRKIDKIEFRFDIKPDGLEQFNLHDSFEDFMRYLKNKGYKFFAKNHEDCLANTRVVGAACSGYLQTI